MDPFASATVSFEGIDGEGEAITVSAQSPYYRLTQKVKTYTVEGLTSYLHNMDNIPQETLEVIHERAKTLQNSNLSSISKEELKEMKPVMIYLSTDGERKNCLYEVIEARIETSEKEITSYLVSGFEDVLIDKEQNASLQMAPGQYQGDLVKIITGIYITGYESFDAARADIAASQDIDMELIELDLQ